MLSFPHVRHTLTTRKTIGKKRRQQKKTRRVAARHQPELGRLLRVLIDLALGELRKRLVGLLFLTKRRLEKLN